MKANDKSKLLVIRAIDKFQPKLVKTTYERDLLNLRKKYIYKDISVAELKKDIIYLKSIRNLLKRKTP